MVQSPGENCLYHVMSPRSTSKKNFLFGVVHILRDQPRAGEGGFQMTVMHAAVFYKNRRRRGKKNPAAAAFGGVASFFHRKLFIENNIDVYMYHS